MALDPQLYFAAGAGLFLLSLVLFLLLSIRLNRMNKRYKKMMNGQSGTDLEEALLRIQETLDGLKESSDRYGKDIADIRKDMKERMSRVGALRYNAFGQGGSDLSFSIAILNDYRDGIVLTGLHSREETYMYAKMLEKGESPYTLSPEEKQAVDQAAVGKFEPVKAGR